MPIINFKAEFAELVECGKKRQTIRKMRKTPIKVGDKLYLYTGLRTKEARNLVISLDKHFYSGDTDIRFFREDVTDDENATPLAKAVLCKEVHEIEIKMHTVIGEYVYPELLLDGARLKYTDCDELAELDGFSDYTAMLLWFDKTHGFPFYGQIVRW